MTTTTAVDSGSLAEIHDTVPAARGRDRLVEADHIGALVHQRRRDGGVA